MHELGVVFAMIDTLEEVAHENGIAHISKVTLDLGEVSGVVASYLLDCWRWAADKRDWLEGATLEVCEVEATSVCNACGRTYATVEHGRQCPRCGSEDTELLCGREFQIRDVTVY
ncbi:hydrogenase maturation nickel metallochaperone HypA [Olsenella urininfantis]|uniref:hydrogenase maturation nickel metallochaperone HypA n=1 Tax=Olsenella urininfantis TaxID=1871033 RepID=UPI0009872B77|nr:hydrogenase maturation nickel metallochaperone HypA [Olsenella urininfantis]